jgi:hypothetical protein
VQYLLGKASYRTQEMLDAALYHVADYDLAADRQVAMELRRRVPEADSVYVWGLEPAVYWLSERRPASRFIYNLPQRADWERRRARELLMVDLQASPPELIVVQRGDLLPLVTGDELDSERALEQFPELLALIAREYERVDTVRHFVLYERRPPGDLRAGP